MLASIGRPLTHDSASATKSPPSEQSCAADNSPDHVALAQDPHSRPWEPKTTRAPMSSELLLVSFGP